MKTFKTKLLSYTFLPLFVLSSLLLISCGGNDTVTPPTGNEDCGDHHAVHYGPFTATDHTNTFVDGGIRTFQFSAIPFSTITNICTKTHPSARGSAHWLEDNSRILTFRLVVSVAAQFQYTSNGTYTPGNPFLWAGDLAAGLQQAYGNGPGQIIDFRVEISFTTLGTEAQDLAFLNSRDPVIDMYLDYDEYRAP